MTRKTKAVHLFAWMLATAMVVGCAGEQAGPVESSESSTDTTAPIPPTPPTPDQTVEPVRQPATVGVGKKGRGYGAGPIATPIAAYFSTKQRMVFDIQIPSAMNTYRALNGHFPKSHEEFMKKIVKKNSIRLPELRSGKQYVYDPDKAAKMSTYDPQNPPLMIEQMQ